MSEKSYIPFTAVEVALVLGITDDDEITGERIAEDMLSGKVRFTEAELNRLAAYKGISVETLIASDRAFLAYGDPVVAERKRIAANIIDKGLDVEFAAEVCGLAVDVVAGLVVGRW